MRKRFAFLFFMLISLGCFCQEIITIIPPKPVALGTAFQVQYIVTKPEVFSDFLPPAFNGFRLVSGPSITKGNTVMEGNSTPIQNLSYTLVPLQTGNIKILGLKGIMGSRVIEGEEALIKVIPKPDVNFSSSDLTGILPSNLKSSSIEKTVDENLFIRTDVSRKTCRVGEPIVVTYTLFSRLQTESEAVRSPAFYGFSVVDLVDINDAPVDVQMLDGKVFNSIILRKLVLYPVQAGSFTLDPMYVHNTVEVNDPVLKKTVLYEKKIETESVKIKILPLPSKIPEDFSGAVGKFSIDQALAENKFALNRQGKLVVSISGTGNFIQLERPEIRWPKGIEGFEPMVREELTENEKGLSGKRIYEFTFAGDSSGDYILPPVQLSYFNVDSGKYETISSSPLHFTIEEATSLPVKIEKNNNGFWPFLLLLTLPFLYFLFRRKSRKKKVPRLVQQEEIKPEKFTVKINKEDLQKKNSIDAAYALLSILNEYQSHLNLQGETVPERLIDLQKECRLYAYAGVGDDEGKNSLIERCYLLFN